MVHRTLPHEILDAEWIKGDGYTVIKYADENKSIRYVDAPCNPYFFIESGAYEDKIKNMVQRMRGEIIKDDFISPRREELVKIELPYPSSVRTLRNQLENLKVKTFESEIPFIRRIVWDHGINQCPLKDRCAFDIEVDARSGFPDIKDPFQRILSIAVVGSDGKEYFFAEKDEKETFKQFYDLLRHKYHLITGWNIRDFDNPYLRARAHRIGFKIPFTPIQEIDAMLNYQKASAWGFMGLSYKLDDVADRELGLSKISFRTKIRMQELWDSFIGNQKTLREYNIQDAWLVRKLDEKLRLSELYVTLARFVKLLLRDAVWVSACAEVLIMRELQKISPRVCFPRRTFEDKGSLPGGFVMAPVKGLHFNVFHSDFTSLYNRIIQTYSLSPEIFPWFEEEFLQEQGVLPMGLTLRAYTDFVNKKKASGELFWEPILSTILRKLEAKRKEFIRDRDKISNKESMEYIYFQIGQTALKLIILGCWGILGRSSTRFYNLGLSKNITLGGQDIIQETMRIIESLHNLVPKYHFKVLYADTDGIFFKPLNKELQDTFRMMLEAPAIHSLINQELKKNMIAKFSIQEDNYALDLGARYVASRAFFITKKKYLLRCLWEEGKVQKSDKVAGEAMRRSDSFDLLKESQRKEMNIILESPEDRIEKDLNDFLNQLWKDLRSGKYDEKLIITTGTKRRADQYKSNSPQKKLIRQLTRAGVYRPGDDISWVIKGKTRKGTLDVEALIPGQKKVPPITLEGYKIYWDRITTLVEKFTSGRAEVLGNEKIDQYF